MEKLKPLSPKEKLVFLNQHLLNFETNQTSFGENDSQFNFMIKMVINNQE